MAHSERQLYIPVMFTHVGKISVKIEALSLLGVMSHTQTIKVDVSLSGSPNGTLREGSDLLVWR